MGEVGLQPLQHVLCADTLGKIDQTDQRDTQVIGCARTCYGEQYINDPPVECGEFRRFLKELFSTIPAFQDSSESAGTMIPHPGNMAEQLTAVPCAEHLHCVVINFFDHKRFLSAA